MITEELEEKNFNLIEKQNRKLIHKFPQLL